jgi:hypothetical protein
MEKRDDLGIPLKALSWDELTAEIVKKYDAKAENNILRRGMRNGKGVAQTLNALKEMIPSDYGLVVLKSGMSFVFQVSTCFPRPKTHGYQP